MDNYEDKIHRIGRCTLLIGLCITFLLPLSIWVVYGVKPPIKILLNGFLAIAPVMIIASLIEIITFTPLISSSGMYIAYLTGNITNLKIPSAVIAMENAEVVAGTEEGDVISTIAMVGSVIASEVVIILGVMLIVPLSGYLNNPIIKPAFEQVMPALFGSLGMYYILKSWKTAIIPIIFAYLLNLLLDIPTALTIPLCVLVSVISSKIMYKKGLLKSTN